MMAARFDIAHSAEGSCSGKARQKRPIWNRSVVAPLAGEAWFGVVFIISVSCESGTVMSPGQPKGGEAVVVLLFRRVCPLEELNGCAETRRVGGGCASVCGWPL